jgi:hypothetical protein
MRQIIQKDHPVVCLPGSSVNYGKIILTYLDFSTLDGIRNLYRESSLVPGWGNPPNMVAWSECVE